MPQLNSFEKKCDGFSHGKALDSHRFPLVAQHVPFASMQIDASVPLLRDQNGNIRGRAYPEHAQPILQNLGPLRFDLCSGTVNGIANEQLPATWQSTAPFPVNSGMAALGILEYDPVSGITRVKKGSEVSGGSSELINNSTLPPLSNLTPVCNVIRAFKLTNNTDTDRNIISLGIRAAPDYYNWANGTYSVHSCGSGTNPDEPTSENMVATVNKDWASFYYDRGSEHVFYVNIPLAAGASVWIVVDGPGCVCCGDLPSPTDFSSIYKYSSDGVNWTQDSTRTNDFYLVATTMVYGAPEYPESSSGFETVALLGTPTWPIKHGQTTTLVERDYSDIIGDGAGDLDADQSPICSVPFPMHLHSEIDGLDGFDSISTHEITTTDATATALATVALAEGETKLVEARILVKQGDDHHAVYCIKGLFYRGIGADVTQQGSTLSMFASESNADWNATLSVNTSEQAAELLVTGTAATSINWKAVLHVLSLP